MTSPETLHIGVDDTDSKKGMCTTYVGAVLAGRLANVGASLVGHPRLIRLNPNIPWKTRGNCAVALKVQVEAGGVDRAKRCAVETVGELAELDVETTNPGVVFLAGDDIPHALHEFAYRAVTDVVSLEDAERLCREVGAEARKFKTGHGVIGALAAIGNRLSDRTFELIAYRGRENWGTPRRIDGASVFQMDAETSPETFDNIDPLTGEVRITPHTPCPILFGIRGESPQAVERAYRLVNPRESIERWVVYETNQATDQHIREMRISEVKDLASSKIVGRVTKGPRVLEGGHVVFTISDGSGELDCAAYEPTRSFAAVVSRLAEGDEITVYGGVKRRRGQPLTLNLEKIHLLRPNRYRVKENPVCACGKRTKSMGREKGFRCERCGKRYPNHSAILREEVRELSAGSYEVPPRARRHLSRPISRSMAIAEENSGLASP